MFPCVSVAASEVKVKEYLLFDILTKSLSLFLSINFFTSKTTSHFALHQYIGLSRPHNLLHSH